jgi:MarR family 2-MHQ and catechol resistance regulon transcriptional repressor
MSRIYQHSGKHLFIVLWKMYQSLSKVDNQCIREAGFASQSDFAILEILHHLGPQTIKKIGDRIRLTSGSITTAIQRLEKIKWVAREANPNDKRQIYIHLTEAGRQRIEPTLDAHAIQLEQAFKGLKTEERTEFARLCQKLETSLA